MKFSLWREWPRWSVVTNGKQPKISRYWLTLLVPRVAKINFLLMTSIHWQEIRLWEAIKRSPNRKCLDRLSNSLNQFFKKMYGDQISGFVHFFEQKIHELFKDFQGHIPHFSRTPFSAKKEPWVYVFFSSSTTWVILSRRSFCVYSFFFGVLLKLLSYRWNSRTFQHRLQLSRTFKALNFYFKI